MYCRVFQSNREVGFQKRLSIRKSVVRKVLCIPQIEYLLHEELVVNKRMKPDDYLPQNHLKTCASRLPFDPLNRSRLFDFMMSESLLVRKNGSQFTHLDAKHKFKKILYLLNQLRDRHRTFGPFLIVDSPNQIGSLLKIRCFMERRAMIQSLITASELLDINSG